MSDPGPAALPPPPTLDPAALARAFPFHLHMDAQLRVVRVGAALRKLMPGLQPATPLLSLFDVHRPRAHDTVDGWRRHAGQLCTLRSRAGPRLSLRGSAEALADGSLLLLVAPALGSIDELSPLGLGLDDFARHDSAADLLLLARTAQMSAQDAQRLADRLRERTNQLGTMLALSDSGVAYFDATGRLLQANRVLSTMLGLPHESLVDGSLEQLRAELALRLAGDEPQRDPLRAAVAADDTPAADDATPLAQAREPTPVRVRLTTPRPLVLEVRTRRSHDGGRVFFLRDVTYASEVDRMKSDFLSAAAHELRTPMASIFGFAELMLHRELPEPRRRELLETIHGQAAQLIRIVNELLDLARIEARGGQDLQRAPTRLEPLIDGVLAVQHLRASQRLRRVDGAHPDVVLMLDAGKFAQALGNVLSNACKFSPDDGEIVVETVAGPPDSPAMVGVRVSDRGIGMAADELARVFERFYRADRARSVPGSGLGMSLVKEIVELHDGRIDVESSPGEGTRVTLWWPVARGAGVPAAGSSGMLAP